MGNERLKIRRDILRKVTSAEAAQVTPYLSAMYLRLVQAPAYLWEREDVLRLSGTLEGGDPISAWSQLIALTMIPPETVKNALAWLHENGVISYLSTIDEQEIVISFEGLSRP